MSRTERKLPPADCKHGYTADQLDAILGDRRGAFDHWMRGQTCAVCTGKLYDHSKQEYYEDGCGPHGVVVYGHDLAGFLAGHPVLD